MIDQLKQAEIRSGLAPSQCLQFEPTEVDAIAREADPHGRLYNSRTGPAAAYRFRPRYLEEFRQSYTDEQANIHPSVFDRIKRNTDGYSPHNLSDRSASQADPLSSDGDPFPEQWQASMVPAKSYSYLQQVVYHLLMLPVVFVAFLLIWKVVLTGLNSLPCWSIWLDGWFGPFVSLREVVAFGVVAVVVCSAALIASELLQAPLRRYQTWSASHGWSSVFPQSRINDKKLLTKASLSSVIRWSECFQRGGFLNHYNQLVTLIIHLLVYTLGWIYWGLNRSFIQKRRLKEIKNPDAGLKRLAPGDVETLFFETDMYRIKTGVLLTKGDKYQVSVEKACGWFDGDFPATQEALSDAEHLPAFMKWARRFSRPPVRNSSLYLVKTNFAQAIPYRCRLHS